MALEGLKNLGPLLDAVGLYLTSKAQGAFRAQGRGGASWPERGVPNRVAVLEDLRAGRTPPSRRFEPRPAGIDTGRLRSSIAYSVSGTTVTVGSNLEYASDVQRGATKTVEVDRQALAAWLSGLSKTKRKAMSKSFGFLFRRGSLTVTTPPRPFVMVTDEDRQKINDIAQKFFASGGWRK